MVCFYLIIIYEFCPKHKEKSSDLKSSRMGRAEMYTVLERRKTDCILFLFLFLFCLLQCPFFLVTSVLVKIPIKSNPPWVLFSSFLASWKPKGICGQLDNNGRKVPSTFSNKTEKLCSIYKQQSFPRTLEGEQEVGN